MAVNVGRVKEIYEKSFNEVGFSGTLLINVGADDWTEYPGIRMMLRKATPAEMTDPVYQDSTVIMILAADMPAGITKVKTRDRVRDDTGKEMTFVKSDLTKRSVQGQTMALEGVVRG